MILFSMQTQIIKMVLKQELKKETQAYFLQTLKRFKRWNVASVLRVYNHPKDTNCFKT